MQNTNTFLLHFFKKRSRNLFFLLFTFFFIFQANAADFFWVGGSGNWSNFGTHWATTSGGATFHPNAPTATDNIFFDGNSGTAGYTVTLDIVAVANNFTFSGNAFSFDGANSLTINGTSTNSSIQTITFGGTNTYSFAGDYTGGLASITRFTTSDVVDFDANISIDNGSTFSFTPNAATTIAGDFISSSVCSTPNTINSTGGVANITFTGAATWTNTNVTNIAATGGVTLQSGTIATSTGITDNTTNRNLFWVGGTGNWNDESNWSLVSGGTGGECTPTATDNVNFDAASGLAGGTVTLDVVASVLNFDYDVAGATFNAANSLTVNGTTTIAATRIIDFEGTNSYNFIGDFTANATTTTNFSNGNVAAFGNVTVEQGSTFAFSSSTGGQATVSGTFTPNGNCSNPITLTATGAFTAPVNFANPQTWSGVNVNQINSTGANVTINSISVVMTGNFTDGTAGGRTLFWVGDTGNWSDETHWSLTSGGTGGECIPTGTDDVNFDAASFTLAGQTVTIDIDGTCRDMDWTGVTNTPSLTGAVAREFTLTGSLTLAAAMTQTGLAPTFEGLMIFASETPQNITTNGKGLNRVRFQTGSAGEWTLQDAFLVQNQTLLNSGILNTNNQDLVSGTLSTNNVLTPTRNLNLGSSVITLTGASTTVLDYRNDTNFTLNSGTSTITISGDNTTIETATLAKTISNLDYTGAGARVINTGSDVNTITFQDVTVSDNGTFDINGTSPKVYNTITIGNTLTSTINGVATDLGNTVNNNIVIATGGTTNFNGGYAITGNITAADGSTLDFGTTAGNNNFAGTVTLGDAGIFLAGGARDNTFIGAFTLGTSATATFSNTPIASNNSFSTINMNEGATFAFSSIATSTISGNINVLGSCSSPVILTSNNPPTQATVDFANPQDWNGVNANHILATTNIPNISNGAVGGNTNITGNAVSRDLFWVHSVAGAGSIGNWYDAVNWSATSGGAGGECPPTIYDNVFFDDNSFSAAGQIVDMDADAFCRNMDWSDVTNNPFLQSIGEDADLTVGGNLTFVNGMSVGTGGTNPNEIRDIYFAATNAIPSAVATTNNTIDWGIPDENTNSKRFQRAFFDQNKEMIIAGTASWTLLSAFNLTQEVPFGRLTLQNGNIITNSNSIQIRILDANGATGSLDIGDSEITLRATGLTFDFRNDANFNFINPNANSFFSLTSGGANVEGYTGSEQKELPDIIVTQNNNVTIDTDNGGDRITFRNIDLQDNNVLFNLTGTSPKTYTEALSFNVGVNATFEANSATNDRSIFEEAITFATNSQANFIGQDQFQSTFTVGGTAGTGIRFTGTGRNRFQGDVTLGAGSLFSLQNTSGPPNEFTNVTLADAVTFEFSANADADVTGNFVAIADCLTPIIIRSSTAGNAATVNFTLAQTWENVIVTDINNTGTVVTVNSGTDGGNNTGIDFSTITLRTLYWVHNGNPAAATGASTTDFAFGNWNDPNNWSLASGGQTGECPPTLNDDVFFDANSFGGNNQIVNIDVDAQTRDMTWTGATGTPIFTGAATFNLQIGGSLTFINAINFTFAGETLFRNTNTGTNIIASDGQVFNGVTTFYDNTVGTGIWELADDFQTAQTFNLVDGTFTTSASNHQLTARIIDVFTIANGVGDPTRELNLNSSVANATRDGGLAVDFRGNTTNFVLSSTATSELHITGVGDIDLEMGEAAKTIPNLFIDNTVAGNSINVNSSNIENNLNRITFRDITVLQDGLIFNMNGDAPKTYKNITFPNASLVDFRGVTNAAPLLNLYTGTVNFGQNTRIDWFGDNQFQQPVTIASTTNNGNAVRLHRDNEFLATAPLTFSAVGRARFTAGGGNRTNIFRAPVNFLGGRNIIVFNGNGSTTARFISTLFIASTAAQQAFIDFQARPEFHAQVEFGEAAGGNATTQVRFRRGSNFTPAPAGTRFITGNDSRITFENADVSVIRDMDVGENNVLTFNNDLTIDNLNLTRFDVVNFPNSDGTAANNGVTTITGFMDARSTSCDQWISIRSNLATVRAEIDFQNPHLVSTNTNLNFTFVQDIENTSANTVEASPDPIVNIANNVGITFVGAVTGTTYYWVENGLGDHSGNWNDLNGTLPTEQLNHWALSSGGTATGCIPTPNDNVIFDENSFGADNDIVTLDNFFSYCKDMIWEDEIFTTSGFRPRLQGDNIHVLQIYGNLRFPHFPTRLNWNQFQGLTEFRGTSTAESKTILSNGSRFNGPVEFDSPVDDWSLLDSMRLNGGGRGNLIINYGELISNNQNIRLDHDWTVNAPTGSLPQGRFIAGTGTVTFYGNPDADIEINDFQTGAACSECTDPVALTGCSGSPFYNLTIEKRFDRGAELNTTVSIYNNFHIVSGRFEDDGFQVRGNTTGTVYMYDNTLLRLGVNSRATTFPTCYLSANVTLSSGTPNGFANNVYTPQNDVVNQNKASIVEYRCPDDQLIRGLTYGTLYLHSAVGGGNNTKRFTGSATINGDFFINDDQRIRDMGFQITGNDFAEGNRFRMDDNSALFLGTNQDVTQNTYPVSGFEPDGMTFPPTSTEFESIYGATNVVADNIATTLPKFTNAGELDDLATGGKMDLRGESSIVYNAGSPQEVTAGFTYSRAILRATGLATIIPKTVTRHNLLSDAEMRVSLLLRIENFNSLIDDGNQIIGVTTPRLEAQANSQLIIGNQTVATLFPTVFVRANIDLDANDHETIYNSDVNQFMSNEPIYGNITLTAPNSIDATLVEKRFRPDPAGTNAGLTADIRGNLLINPRNHLIDEGNQITGLASKSVTMNSDAPLGESMLTLGTNAPTDIATEFPLTFGTIVLNDLTTVIYNAGGGGLIQRVRGAGLNGAAVGTDSYYNLIIQSNNEFTARKLLQAPTRIRNNFTIRRGSRFEDRQHQVTGSTSTAAGLLTMEDGASLYIGLNNTGLKTVFPTNYERARIILDDNSNVRYQSRRTVAPFQFVSSEPIYGNLFLASGYGAAGANVPKIIAPTPVTATNTTLTVDGDLTVHYRVRFEDVGIQIIGNSTNNLLIEDGSELVLGTATEATLFPTDFTRGNSNLSDGDATKSIVIYNSSVTGNDIAGGAGVATTEINNPIYGDVILRSAAGTPVTKNLLGNVVIRGDLLIENNNTLETTASNFNINLAENWTCQPTGVFNSQQGRVILDGTTEQRLTTNAQKFFELEASSTGGSFRMIDDVTIKENGQTIFNTGLFIPDDIALGTNSTRMMVFERNATIGGSGTYSTAGWISTSAASPLSANGPSNVSHVVGKVQKIGDDAFMFPIGNGTSYAPAGLSERNSSTSVFEARYVGPRFPTLDGYDVDLKEPSIQVVSNVEYWLINNEGAADDAFVYLSWEAARSVAYQPEGLLVLRWDDPTPIWQNRLNGGYTNASAQGVVVSQAKVGTFSPFTLGSITNFNPLPLDLLSFDAKVEGESVKLDWKTTNEIDNSHFMVERSQDGNTFGSLGRVNAKGTGLEGTFEYQFWDAEPYQGLSYYRLQMFDLNGTFKYSPVRSILFEKEISGIQGKVSLYPNPNGGARFYLNLDGKLTTDAQIQIVDMTGRIVHQQNVQKGGADIIITPMQVLPAGAYLLRFVTQTESITKKFIVE
ncbi:T9SS type A sorting domain-containing protein [Bernardetia sp. ABR2-2B]|uniref:T9SS type A sorting domain-containing protein n=1 Tax=Bernardetia sp. ABR2-2B TaxID=3127472 RepID=UPI0030D13A48